MGAALAAVGVAGPWGGLDPERALGWLALWALPAGVLAARSDRPWRVVLLAPVLLGVFVAPALEVPDPIGGGAAAAGLYALGVGLGLGLATTAWRAAGAAWLTAVALAGLPSLAGVGSPAPWPPALAARLLDVSPIGLVAESAGIDWMRHATVYDPVGSSSIGPELRAAWPGRLAGAAVLLLGCLSALTGGLAARAPRTVPRPPE